MQKTEITFGKMKIVSFDPSRDRIDPNMRSSANDPFVQEMTRRSQEILQKYGFPKELLKFRAEQMIKASK